MTDGGRAGVADDPAGDVGQSTVELALALPLLGLLALLMVQIGLVVHDDLLVAHAAREAARVAAVSRDPAAPLRAAERAGPLTAGRLAVEVRPAGGESPSVEVRVRYHCVTDLPLVGVLVPDIELESTTVMTREW